MKREKRVPIRVVIAKPGLDGHDIGAKLICRALMAAGMEVIYTGLRQSPEAIVEVALKECADVVGLSILSGAHMHLCGKVVERLKAHGLDNVTVIVGGNIPRGDHDKLKALGVHGIFPTGTPFTEVVRFIEMQTGH